MAAAKSVKTYVEIGCDIPCIDLSSWTSFATSRFHFFSSPVSDEDEAVDELVRFVNDGDYRQKLAEDAQDYALSEFTWPAVAEKYLGVYADTSLE